MAVARAAVDTHLLDPLAHRLRQGREPIGHGAPSVGPGAHHVDLGATREEVAETMAMAVYMGGGPSLMYAADALRAYDQFKG